MDLFKKRSYVIIGFILTVFVVYIARLFYIQVLDTTYRQVADQNVIKKETLYPNRGLIYDRNGKLVVINDAIYEIHVIPRQVKELDTLLFCKLLSIDKTFFVEQLAKATADSRYRPYLFLKHINPQQYATFQEYLYRFPGFFGKIRMVRNYPYRAAAHVVGYISEVSPQQIKKNNYYVQGDYIGTNGLENTYEKVLRGVKGSKLIIVDKFNRELGPFDEGNYDTLAVSGLNLITSLDIELQKYAEDLMQNKKGSVVAIEPSTGEVLVMVSSPTYDPNLLSGRERGMYIKQFQHDTLMTLFNRPIMASQYPPGSTFKPLNAMIGLEEGTLNVNTGYPCSGGYHMGSITVGCHAHPAAGNLTQGIMHSCNAYFCYTFRNIVDQGKFHNMDEALGTWNEYLYSFGLGKKTGIDMPGELPGLVPTPKLYNKVYGKGRWKSSTIISLSIGQGEIGMTPLQLANYMAAIANRGYYYTPHLIKKIEGDTTDLLKPYRVKHVTKVSRHNFDPIVEGLYQTCEQGTGRIARIEGYQVCGKTGTAQNPHGKDHSVFVAFAPKENPKIAIAVFVENSGFGATYAAPIASLVMEKYLNDTIAAPRLPLEKRMLEADLIHPKVIAQKNEEQPGDIH
ncbi:MAG: penicillin-binding protein 2 [Chitinophagales bacterium]|nr:penicillin-binding protein 2 [Chitinophagales bacterium]